MEATRRNAQIVKNLAGYYPSVSQPALRELCRGYKEVSIDEFNEKFLDNPSVLNHKDNPDWLFTINGRIKSIRFSGQKIVFIDLYSTNNGLKIIRNCN